MLQTISWKDYSITIGLLTGLYYGWWLIRYYPSWQKRTSTAPQGKSAQTDKPAVAITEPQKSPQAEPPQLPRQPVQAESLQAEKPAEAKPQPELPFPKEGTFLATIEAHCKNDVLRVLEKASMAGVAESELLELLHSLLTSGPYPKLKGTILQENVDALIGRELERYGSIHPALEVIRKLWEVDG